MDDRERLGEQRAEIDARLAELGLNDAARQRWWTASNPWIGCPPAIALEQGDADKVRFAAERLRSWG
jgi:hypothetical protein